MAQMSIAPCGERLIGGSQRDGAAWYVIRFVARPGRACDMDLNINANAMLREVRVTTAPKIGRLLSAKPNRITYQAAPTPAAEVFSLAIRVRNLRGEGWMNIAIEVVPGR